MKLVVLGAGSFGSAMAIHASGIGHEVVLWCRRKEQACGIAASGENPDYIKGVRLPSGIRATADLHEALSSSDWIVFAVPTQSLRSLAEEISCLGVEGRKLHILNLAKGIEIGTGRFPHRILGELLPGARYCALSGPSHAEEVARGMPTALVAAASDEADAVAWQEILNDNRLRVYTSKDVVGVEIGGAMKNVIAIAVGVARAIRFGDNSVAAIATRGLAEIMRYGVLAGANPLTLAGLAGIGDLMATCYSRHSRNLRFGMAVGEGKSASEAASEIGQVVEGMHTVRALVLLARKKDIELPISEGVYKVLYENAKIKDILTELLFRDPKPEIQTTDIV